MLRIDDGKSAQRASETPSTANPFPGLAHVRIPGSTRTYEVRDVLRGMGLRWDPRSHAWHGTLPATQGALLGRQYGLKPQIVPTIEAFSAERVSRVPVARPTPPVGPRSPVHPHVPHDGSRTHAEARVAYRDGDEDAEEIATPTRQFSLLEITSGLPDDSREADERFAERRLRDLRGRVKVARAVVSGAPGLAEVLQRDWQRAARYDARLGITEAMFRYGVPIASLGEADDCAEQVTFSVDGMRDERGHGFPSVRDDRVRLVCNPTFRKPSLRRADKTSLRALRTAPSLLGGFKRHEAA